MEVKNPVSQNIRADKKYLSNASNKAKLAHKS